jgi:protein-S-isoprenylcysteine O-methyltransferase
MKLPGPQHLGWIYLISELLLTVTRRSRGTGVRQDRSTLWMLWVIISLGVIAGVYVAQLGAPRNIASHNPLANFARMAVLPDRDLCRLIGVILFAVGLALRWWSIIVLGRFFTVDVQIARDHELVDRGPFRLVRHPSYTGVLLAFVGFALSLANWAALLVMLVPIFIAFIRRMDVEEEALSAALGERYVGYMTRTKRLVPGVY